MGNWKNIDQYKKLYRFIGRQSSRLLMIGVLTGISLFCVEVTFAYLLQAFLVVLKVVPSSTNMNFPSWLPVQTPLQFLFFVTLVLCARGTIRWLHSFLTAAAYEVQRAYQRKRLIEWAFSTNSISSGQFVNLYNTGIENVSSSLVGLQNIAILFSTSLFIFLYLLKISFLVTFISFLILAMIAFIMRKLDVRIAGLGKSVTHELEQINRTLLLNIKNLLLLQIYGTQQKEKTKVVSRVDAVLNHVFQYLRFVNLKGSLPQTLGVVLICSLSVLSTQRSWIPAGLMITYFYLFLQFVQNFSEVIKLASTISFSVPAAEQFAKWWADHAHDGIRNQFNPMSKETPIPFTASLGWRFSNVTFSYPNQDHTVLRNFSLTIQSNTCTILLGESGSGKSTVLSLALGLYPPSQGTIAILLDGKDARPLEEVQEKVLLSVGYVGPESFLIEGTIKENLLYGLNDQPGDNDIWTALETAECQFVEQLPNKLNHKLTEQGQGLSAGQKQRLSFARAILRKPSVLILDEATSNLDSETEEKLVRTLGKLKGSVTILAVTHREALLAIADQTVKLPQA